MKTARCFQFVENFIELYVMRGCRNSASFSAILSALHTKYVRSEWRTCETLPSWYWSHGKRYQRWLDAATMEDYFWGLVRQEVSCQCWQSSCSLVLVLTTAQLIFFNFILLRPFLLSVITCLCIKKYSILLATFCININVIIFVRRFDSIQNRIIYIYIYKLRGLSPHANYTDRAAAAGRRS